MDGKAFGDGVKIIAAILACGGFVAGLVVAGVIGGLTYYFGL